MKFFNRDLAVSIAELGHRILFNHMVRSGLILGALSLTVDDIATVPEAQRSLYVEKDGKHHLDVTGIEDTSGLKSALQKEREANKEAKRLQKEIEARYEGIDPDKVKSMMAKFENDDEAKLIAAGKIDEVVTKRTEKLRIELQKQVDAAKGETKAAADRAGKFSQRVLDNHIRAAAIKAGLHAHAVEDALFRARILFSLDDAGEAVQIDNEGRPVLGKDGKTPFTPVEWLENMKETAPHWFPASGSGGGAGGGSKDAGGVKTINREKFNQLNPAEKAKILKTHKLVD